MFNLKLNQWGKKCPEEFAKQISFALQKILTDTLEENNFFSGKCFDGTLKEA